MRGEACKERRLPVVVSSTFLQARRLTLSHQRGVLRVRKGMRGEGLGGRFVAGLELGRGRAWVAEPESIQFALLISNTSFASPTDWRTSIFIANPTCQSLLPRCTTDMCLPLLYFPSRTR